MIINNSFIDSSNEGSFEELNDSSVDGEKEASTPYVSRVSVVQESPYKNLHKDSHKNEHKKDNSIIIDNDFASSFDDGDKKNILEHIPNQFISLMKPYYDEQPELIIARWKTVCVAVKRSCLHMDNTSWDTIEHAWKIVVNRHKRKLVNNTSEDGLGGYFYGVLCDYLIMYYLKTVWND